MFWKKKPKCPITKEDKDFVEHAFTWILESFGNDILKEKIILPKWESFGFKFSGQRNDSFLILDNLCKKMNIDSSNILLDFYSERVQVDFGEGLISKYAKNTVLSAGKYIQYDNDDILIEENQLKDPVSLIATIAHELAHYKLLYEKRVDKNNEFITDIITIIYGLGIFGANTSVVKMQTWLQGGSSGWKIKGGSGYLHFKVWGYALAYYSFLRKDTKAEWSAYLEKDVLSAFEKSVRYLNYSDE